MRFDIIIVGGGPVGLSFARALAGSGLSIAVVDQQERQVLADPGYDGREIALTLRSVRSLSELGAWERLPAEGISELRKAHVLNGNSPLALQFDTGGHAEKALGMLVSNHDIRRTLYECVTDLENITLMTDAKVTAASANSLGARATLSTGEVLECRLLVAADSRFSTIRPKLGIKAEMKQFGKAMLVCRVEHELEHDHVATEWFGSGHTIAMLPLNWRVSSAVLTLPLGEAERLAALPSDLLGETIARHYDHKLGSMRVASSVHVYSLVMTYADHFAVPGAALIGDTAVGMHPVTAHGFNLGLASAMTLAEEIRKALRLGLDWAGEEVLRRYESRHWRASKPLYRATDLIVRLYSDERPRARLARHAAIRLGRRMPFFREAVRSMLMQA